MALAPCFAHVDPRLHVVGLAALEQMDGEQRRRNLPLLARCAVELPELLLPVLHWDSACSASSFYFYLRCYSSAAAERFLDAQSAELRGRVHTSEKLADALKQECLSIRVLRDGNGRQEAAGRIAASLNALSTEWRITSVAGQPIYVGERPTPSVPFGSSFTERIKPRSTMVNAGISGSSTDASAVQARDTRRPSSIGACAGIGLTSALPDKRVASAAFR